jgi:hypothetical protein
VKKKRTLNLPPSCHHPPTIEAPLLERVCFITTALKKASSSKREGEGEGEGGLNGKRDGPTRPCCD